MTLPSTLLGGTFQFMKSRSIGAANYTNITVDSGALVRATGTLNIDGQMNVIGTLDFSQDNTQLDLSGGSMIGAGTVKIGTVAPLLDRKSVV